MKNRKLEARDGVEVYLNIAGGITIKQSADLVYSEEKLIMLDVHDAELVGQWILECIEESRNSDEVLEDV